MTKDNGNTGIVARETDHESHLLSYCSYPGCYSTDYRLPDRARGYRGSRPRLYECAACGRPWMRVTRVR